MAKELDSDVLVVGAGVIGAAVAAEVTARGLSCVIVDKGARTPEGVTSRNSGVIHAGLYYPADSLKAELCIEGNRLLYEWCGKQGVDFSRCGKWVVATSDEEVRWLEDLRSNALNSGAKALGAILSPNGDTPKGLEHVSWRAAFESPLTGIIDPVELTRSFEAAAAESGCQTLTSCEVRAGEPHEQGGYRVDTSKGEIHVGAVVNAAGLHCDQVARVFGIDKYKIYPWRGDYFRMRSGGRKFSHLIYPVKVPGAAGLGVHLTLDLTGGLRLGPDVEYSGPELENLPDREDKRKSFAAAVRRYLPFVREEDLEYDTWGLRPKLRAPSEKAEKDFVIAEDLPRFINLIGIESPGITSSIAIARRVAALL